MQASQSKAHHNKAAAKAIAVTHRIEWALVMTFTSVAFLLLHFAGR